MIVHAIVSVIATGNLAENPCLVSCILGKFLPSPIIKRPFVLGTSEYYGCLQRQTKRRIGRLHHSSKLGGLVYKTKFKTKNSNIYKYWLKICN